LNGKGKRFCLKNAKVYVGGKLFEKDLFLKDGKIESIGGKPEKSYEIIECSGKIIFPGVIDSHIHAREPGLTWKEDYKTISKAAAAGGVTTFLDMPNSMPPTLSVRDLDGKRKLAAKKSIVNFGFHFGSSQNNLSEIKKAKNVASTKVYMNHTTGDMLIDDGLLLEEIFRNSKRVMAHAEDDMVKVAVALAKKTGKRLHLAHISKGEEIEWIARNKTDKITVEATPHHLFLSDNKKRSYAVKPSLNAEKDKRALWKAIKSGLIDTIGSDHAPHLLKEKKKNMTYGLPGVETLLPLMLNAVNEGKLSVSRLVELCCENPVKIFRIRNKGYIRKGYDADLVVVDLEKTMKVEAKNLHSKCGWSPYEAMKLRGWPVMTLVGGEIVSECGKICSGKKGREVQFRN
jgi:dihydroorotase